MKIFTQKLTSEATRRSAEAMPLKPGVSWARFGNDKLMFSDEPAEPRAATRGARIPSRDEEVTREQLHVVVQNGRQFQQHHPEVPVLHDRGRFLLVQLDPDQAQKLRRKSETCYGIVPLEDEQVVFEERAPEAGRAPVPFIRALVDQAKRATLEPTLQKLVSFPTRNSTSSGFTSALTFMREQLTALGYQTRVQTVAVGTKSSKNLIADKPGVGSGTRKVVIATAHLDSVNLQGGATAAAPGADDDGSGSAGVLEIARAFRAHRGQQDLRLILFGGEEQGLFGSKHYVRSLTAKERTRIRAVVNMDMIGSLNSATRSVLLEGAAVSQSVIDGLSAAAATYTQLGVETSLNPFSSDHVPFINAGVPAVLTIEGSDNANSRIHTAADTIAHIDYDLMLEILRMNIAFIAAEVT